MTFYEKVLDYKAQGKVYVIAELGSNFKSDTDLLNSISLAKHCGADAVKFQYLTPGELYGPTYEINKVFPLGILKAKADAVGIDFLCSAFSPEGVREVNKFVPCHKIASSEMSHVRIIEAVKATGKPVILSTGGYFIKDIERSLKHLEGYPCILMHCNLKYPTKFVDLFKFQSLMALWPGPLGYSDHTTSVDAVPVLMMNMGVTVYEKHFNPFDYTDTPDAPHALNAEEFQVMVSYFKGDPKPYTEENEARVKYVRRVLALKDIMAGEVFKEGENVGIFRPRADDARGANPFAIERINGKSAGRSILAGEGVSVADAI